MDGSDKSREKKKVVDLEERGEVAKTTTKENEQ
jgi:hypothetical protein